MIKILFRNENLNNNIKDRSVGWISFFKTRELWGNRLRKKKIGCE